MTIKKSLASLFSAGAVVVLLAACAPQTNGTTNNASVLPTDVPSECVTTNLVTIKSEKAGTVNPEVANSYFKNWRTDSVQLIFANYAVDPQDIYSNITAGRVLTVINLIQVDGTKITAGDFYKAATVGGNAVNKKIVELNISTSDLAGGVFDDNALVEVKFLNDKYACGTITSDDGSSSIKGNFIAKFLAQ